MLVIGQFYALVALSPKERAHVPIVQESGWSQTGLDDLPCAGN
jgi:hypothetical protein